MDTLTQPPVSDEQDGPGITPYFDWLIELELARRAAAAARAA